MSEIFNSFPVSLAECQEEMKHICVTEWSQIHNLKGTLKDIIFLFINASASCYSKHYW